MGQGASLGEEAVLADSGRVGEVAAGVGRVRMLAFLNSLRMLRILRYSSSQVALRGRPENAATLIRQFYGQSIIRRERQLPVSIAAHHHKTHLAVFVQA